MKQAPELVIAKKKFNPNVTKLRQVYDEFGPESAEFWAQVENFLKFVQMRHMGKVEQDVTQKAYLRVRQSMAYFNPQGKANLASWIYSVCRNVVSNRNYQMRRRLNETDIGDVVLYDTRSSSVGQEFVNRDAVEVAVKSLQVLSIDGQGNLCEFLRTKELDSPVIRLINWYKQEAFHAV